MCPWNHPFLCQDRSGCCLGVNKHVNERVPVQLQGEPAVPQASVPPNPVEPPVGSTSDPSELESKLAPGIIDTEAMERAENVENSGSKKDVVCG